MHFANHRWYVSIETPRKGRPTSSRTASVRQTKAFPTESEAKQYAREMLSEGWKITAGTLNPHLPKRRIISASEIEQWVGENEL
jgi:hypothetical protein